MRLTTLSSALPGDSDNNTSCVLLVELAGTRIVLPGDIDRKRERDLVAYWGDRLVADLLVAAHHGSGSSTSRLWLRHVKPRDVLFTTARANRFGHPAAEVLDAVRGQGARRWNTARHGAVTVHLAGGAYRIDPTRHGWRPFWWLWDEQGRQAAYSRGR